MSKPLSETRSARIRAGLTQQQLAKLSGLSPRTVATADEGGRISSLSAAKLRAALSVPENQQYQPPILPTKPDPYQPPPPPPRVVTEIEVSGKRIHIDTQRYNDLPVVSPRTEWNTVTAVRKAMLNFQEGMLYEASDLVEAMTADDRIKGVVSQRIDGLLGLPFSIDPSEEDNELASELAEQAGDLWPTIAPRHTIRELWKWGQFLGIGVAEKLYNTEHKSGWLPTLKVWHPRYLWWNWAGRCFMLNTREGPIPIREGDPHWVIYTPYGYYRGWMDGLIRSLAVPWLFRQFGYRDWGRYNEVHGIPIRAILEPSEWSDEDKRKALREIAGLASESIIRLPQRKDEGGFDLKLIEATSRTYDSFKLALDKADDSIAIVIVGQNLTTQVKGGAYSAAQVHERVAAAIIRSDSEGLSAAFHEQILVEWAALNHGTEAADIAPIPRWDAEPPEDKGTRATALKTTAEAFATLRSSQLPVDFAKLAETHEVPLLPDVEIPDFVPPAPPAPFGGGKDEEQVDEPDDNDTTEPVDESDDEEEIEQKRQNAAARASATNLRQALLVAKLSRRDRAPLQGQTYVDQLAENGRSEATRILAGDVRALKRVIANAKPGPDGKIDGPAIKAELLKVYRDMAPDKLARVMANCRLLAQLSGQYSLIKEVVSEPSKSTKANADTTIAGALVEGLTAVGDRIAAGLEKRPGSPSVKVTRDADGRVTGFEPKKEE